ncbi:hypothetical protein [Thermobispora bispora]|uniref:hypothetical protein n=1 Tax=Thermobispora bispora TaxID=2006 RepID=UPI00197DE6CE|nr:hypothetical protein [Thermobispora bispora]QSI49994.1 hypothetical protein CYL17_18645 [Thermobispora bispora]
MAKCLYAVSTTGAVQLTASTTTAVLGVRAPESFGLDLKKLRVGFGGTSGAPATVGLYLCTFATNPPGTASTTVTPVQVAGRQITAGFTAAQEWTATPGALTQIEAFPISPNGGLLVYDIPLGDTPDCAPGQGFVLLMNSPAAVGVWASMWVERC